MSMCSVIKIKSEGKFLKVRLYLSTPGLCLVESQNEGHDVLPVQSHRRGADKPDQWGYTFDTHDKKYLLVVKNSKLKLVEVKDQSRCGPRPSEDSHWFVRKEVGGAMFILRPVSENNKFLFVSRRNFSLKEHSYTMFTEI